MHQIIRVTSAEKLLNKFTVGQKVRKIGGGYQVDGTIIAIGTTSKGDVRYMFEFASIPGMLHIFNETQLAARTACWCGFDGELNRTSQGGVKLDKCPSCNAFH